MVLSLGPNDGVERLLAWVFDGNTERSRTSPRTSATGSNREVLEESFKTTRVVMDRRTFDIGEGPWGDNLPFHVSCFVLSHDV
jgi:hypothetical protein